jgi:hypothetical protein
MNSQDIFIKNSSYEEKNGIIHLNLSESNQYGGNLDNNIIHLSISTDNFNNNLYQNGGTSDSSDYFNKLAEKIVNSKITQNGGFNVITTIDESSELFLSSETINDIKNHSMSGGAKKNKTNLNFNFNDLKKHLLKVSDELQGGSDVEDDDEDIFEDDDEDEDDELEEREIKKLFEDSDESESLNKLFKEKKSLEEKEIEKISKPHKISMKSHRGKTHNKQHKQKRSSDNNETDEESDLDIDLESEDDDEDDEMIKNKKNKDNKENDNKAKRMNVPDSESLGNSSTQYQFSDSISSPKLISYRKIENNKTVTGRRYI